MKIVHADAVEWKRGLQHRGGTFHYRHLLNGEPGTPGNFQFNIGQLEGDFSSRAMEHEGYGPLTALHVEDGERAEIVARDDTELLHLVLPDLTGIKERRAAHAVAAE